MGKHWERVNQLPTYAAPSVIEQSTTCPLPDRCLSKIAAKIPNAHSNPPPAKSASIQKEIVLEFVINEFRNEFSTILPIKLIGGDGGSFDFPRSDKIPDNAI